jgi:hypothetical protein
VTIAAVSNEVENSEQFLTGKYNMHPVVKALLRDLSEIRRVALVESPQILPLIAPALIEAEIHARQFSQVQI